MRERSAFGVRRLAFGVWRLAFGVRARDAIRRIANRPIKSRNLGVYDSRIQEVVRLAAVLFDNVLLDVRRRIARERVPTETPNAERRTPNAER